MSHTSKIDTCPYHIPWFSRYMCCCSPLLLMNVSKCQWMLWDSIDVRQLSCGRQDSIALISVNCIPLYCPDSHIQSSCAEEYLFHLHMTLNFVIDIKFTSRCQHLISDKRGSMGDSIIQKEIPNFLSTSKTFMPKTSSYYLRHYHMSFLVVLLQHSTNLDTYIWVASG